MSLTFHFFNIWAVLVGTLINMIVGALWYSPILFGNMWMKLVGLKKEDISKENANKAMMISLIPSFLLIFFLHLILSLANANSILDAVIIGSSVSFGIIGMYQYNQSLYEDKPFSLVLIHVGYYIVSLNLNSILFVLWK